MLKKNYEKLILLKVDLEFYINSIFNNFIKFFLNQKIDLIKVFLNFFSSTNPFQGTNDEMWSQLLGVQHA